MRKNGFTLLEILLAVAIVAVLTVLLMVSAGGLRKQAQARFTESTLAVIMTALQQYHEYWGDYPLGTVVPDPIPGAAGVWSRAVLEGAFGGPVSDATWTSVMNAGHKDYNTSSEALYIALYRTPTSRKIMEKMPSGPKLSGKPQRKTSRMLLFDPDPAPTSPYSAADWPNIPVRLQKKAQPLEQLNLYRFVDAWEGALRYEYRKQGELIPGTVALPPDDKYKTTDQFPVLRSAGPDGLFNTSDDIISGRM